MRTRPSARLTGIRCRVCVLGKLDHVDNDPATVDYLREQTPSSHYNGYSLRRDPCSFDSTLQEGHKMTICSWSTQIHPPHASLSCAVLRADGSLFAITGSLQMFGMHETT